METLALLLKKKFGQEGTSLLADIAKIDDLERLKELVVALLSITTLAEFKKLVQKASSP